MKSALFEVAIALGAFLGGGLVDSAGVQSVMVLGGLASLVGAGILRLIRPGTLTLKGTGRRGDVSRL